MKTKVMQRQSGVSLIEALVSLVILAVGFLSIVKLNTHLIDVAGTSKARAEAVALANSKLAELRNSALLSQYESNDVGEHSDPENPIDGINASFTRNWTVTASSSTSKKVTVNVVWQDKLAASDEGNQSVAVESIVAWQNPKSSFAFSISSTSAAGSFATAPTGQAEVGTGTTSDTGTDTTPPTGSDIDDNLRVKNEGGKTILYSPNENNSVVHLVMPTSYGGFSTVEGYIYVPVKATGQKDPIVDTGEVFVAVSDAAYCWKGDVQNYPVGSTSTTRTHVRVPYRCYVGAEWYGNIGIVSTASNFAGRVCLGDPSISYSSNAYQTNSGSRQAALSASRRYRGYKLLSGTPVVSGETSVTTNIYQSTGIGVAGDGSYISVPYIQQNFLITELSGNSSSWTGESCVAPMQQLSSALYGNAGQYVCLSSQWGALCPNPWPDVSSATLTSIVVSGSIEQPDDGPVEVSVSGPSDGGLSGWACTVNLGRTAYTCSVSLQAYPASVWSAVFTINSGDRDLCSLGASGSGSGSLDTSSKTITFSNQSVANVSQVQGFGIASSDGTCPPNQ